MTCDESRAIVNDLPQHFAGKILGG